MSRSIWSIPLARSRQKRRAMMFIDLLEEPWLFTEHGTPLSDFQSESIEQIVDGRKDLRIVCSYKTPPWYRTRSNRLPFASFPFYSHGEILSHYYLPMPCREKQDKDLKTAFGIGSQVYCVVQKDAVHRYYPEESKEESEEIAVNNWINWSIRLFQEIANDKEEIGDDFSSIARRSWTVVMSHVTEDGAEEAMMSLIVQLTGNKQLRNILKSISNNPRKILERVRENMKVSRIQQLDGACIREFARRPGYDIATKAGPKQELLAVKRIENTNTLENRVYIWVLNTIRSLADKYQRENKQFATSERVKSVRQFNEEVLRMHKAPALSGITTDALIHPVHPNYPLQLDKRYKEVYEAYQKLRHEQKVQDDAWEWQRVLWGCSSRMIFYSLLHNILEVEYSSYVYVKHESQQGRWLQASNAPGPFKDVQKRNRYYLIDSWDIHDPYEWLETQELFPGALGLGRLGCDAVLYCPENNYLLIIWFVYCTESDSKVFNEKLVSCQSVLKRFMTDLKRHGNQLGKIEGLLLTSAFRYQDTNDCLRFFDNNIPHVNMLLIKDKSNNLIDNLQAELRRVLGDFFI